MVKIKNQTKKKDQCCPRARIQKTVLMFFLFGLVFVACVLYVVKVNQIATMGYEIKSKESRIEELKKQNEEMEIQIAQLRSMHNLETEKSHLEMKRPHEVSYLEVESFVAMR